MTGPGFDSLYYTDCVPGQGLRGGAGFQFQAVSPGVSHDTMSLVQRTLLYEAPVAWMREQRDVAEYPPSLTHVFADGVYATARGRYLGAEANGVREGNQFTHAVATADPDVYGLTRPAQLWDAPWWAEKAAPSTECDRLAADPEAGPWGIDSLREWVLGRPAGEEWLLAVHSAFDLIHEPGGRRVLFVGEDAADVLGWIAAGTLLLAQARALRVGFRVFATNPRQSRHDVLAVHDDWAGPFANPDRDNGFTVFNLTTGRHSAVEPTAGARYWVPRFLRDDPYDVVDAIELAQRFTGGEPGPSVADRFAAAVAVLGEAPQNPAEAGELVAWLGECPVPQPEEVVQPAVAAILSAAPGLEALRDLRTAAQRHRLTGELDGRVVRAVFAAELAGINGVTAGADQDVPLVELAERAAEEVMPARMDELLLLATRFRVEPQVGRFGGGAHRFVQWWADHADAAIDPGRWSCGAQMIDLLRDELAARLAGPDAALSVPDVNRVWWRLLLPTATDPATMLDTVVIASAVANGGPDLRRRQVGFVLGELRQPSQTNAQLAWRALFSYTTPTAAELVDFLSGAGSVPLSGWLEDEVGSALDTVVGPRPTAQALDALALIHQHGVLPGHGRLTELAKHDKGVRGWLDVVSSGRQARPSALRLVTEPVLAARSADVLDVFVRVLPLGEAIKIVDLGGEGLAAVLVRELPRYWQTATMADEETAVALAFAAARTPDCPESLMPQAERELRQWIKTAGKERAAGVTKLLATADVRIAAQWRDVAAAKAARPTTGQTERAKAREAKEAKRAAEDKPGWRFRPNKGR